MYTVDHREFDNITWLGCIMDKCGGGGDAALVRNALDTAELSAPSFLDLVVVCLEGIHGVVGINVGW